MVSLFRDRIDPTNDTTNPQICEHRMVVRVAPPENDEGELEQRLRLLRKPLLAYFLRATRNGSEAEDLVQEVYLRIARRGPLDSFERVAGYAFRVAGSVLKDRHRRRVVRHADAHVAFDSDAHLDETPDVERQLIDRDELRSTSIILTQLPDITRAVFVLRRLDELPFAEIALRLRISVSAAEKHMLRATRHLLAHARRES